MDGNPGTADLPPPAAPYDFNKERYYGGRTPEHQPFVYFDDFNTSMRMAFTRELIVSISEGTKYRLPNNMEGFDCSTTVSHQTYARHQQNIKLLVSYDCTWLRRRTRPRQGRPPVPAESRQGGRV